MSKLKQIETQLVAMEELNRREAKKWEEWILSRIAECDKSISFYVKEKMTDHPVMSYYKGMRHAYLAVWDYDNPEKEVEDE